MLKAFARVLVVNRVFEPGKNPQRIFACRDVAYRHEECLNLEFGGLAMLRWAAVFFVIALFAALLGFTGIAGAAASIAKFLFFLFLAVCVILLAVGIFIGKKIF